MGMAVLTEREEEGRGGAEPKQAGRTAPIAAREELRQLMG